MIKANRKLLKQAVDDIVFVDRKTASISPIMGKLENDLLYLFYKSFECNVWFYVPVTKTKDDDELEFSVNIQKLASILNSWSCDTVQLQNVDEKLRLKNGRSQVTLPKLDDEYYDDIPDTDIEDATLLGQLDLSISGYYDSDYFGENRISNEFLDSASNTLSYVSKTESFDGVLSCVHIKKEDDEDYVLIEASDRQKIYQDKLNFDGEGVSFDYLITDKLMEVILRLLRFNTERQNAHVVSIYKDSDDYLFFGYDTGVFRIATFIDSTYPSALSEILEGSFRKDISFDKAEMLEQLKVCDVVASGDSVIIASSKELSIIKPKDTEYESNFEFEKMECFLESPVSFKINGKFFKDIIGSFKSNTLNLSRNKNKISIWGEGDDEANKVALLTELIS